MRNRMIAQDSLWHGLAAGWVLLAIALLSGGCGSLKRSVGFGPLTAEDMKYAETLPATPVGERGQRLPDEPTNSGMYVVPAVPIVYVKQFARFEEGYLLARTISVLPIGGTGRAMLFDKNGRPGRDFATTSIVLLGGLDSDTLSWGVPGPTERWRLRLIEVPILSDIAGPCFGFGSGYLKMLWIPFVDEWRPRSRPVPPTPPAAPKAEEKTEAPK